MVINIKKIISIFLLFCTSCNRENIISEESISYINSMETVKNKALEIEEKLIPYITKASALIDNELVSGQIIEDKGNGTLYHFKNDKIDEWIESQYVHILDFPIIDIYQISDEEMEFYVNYKELTSKTKYLLYADLYRMKLFVFKKEKSYFFIEKVFPCAIGKITTPTKRGTYTILAKGTHFYGRSKEYICYNYLQYSGNYLLHSFPYSLDNMVINNKIDKVSDGCLRFSKEDSLYLYNKIPIDTTIIIN